MNVGEAKLAMIVFKKVLEISPEEPQSFRDLGLAYAATGDHQRAVDTLYEVVLRPWHNRFPDIELIALADLNTVEARKRGALGLRCIDPRLLRNLPLDVRVVLTWDADNTDVNLAVTDPNGQVLYPGGGINYQGGRMSQNYSGGYGPEEYSLRKAKPGKYQFVAHFAASAFAERDQSGSPDLRLSILQEFGRPPLTPAKRGALSKLLLDKRYEPLWTRSTGRMGDDMYRVYAIQAVNAHAGKEVLTTAHKQDLASAEKGARTLADVKKKVAEILDVQPARRP